VRQPGLAQPIRARDPETHTHINTKRPPCRGGFFMEGRFQERQEMCKLVTSWWQMGSGIRPRIRGLAGRGLGAESACCWPAVGRL